MRYEMMAMVGLIILAACTQSGTDQGIDGDVDTDMIDSFEKCAERYPVMESYPAQCRTPDGKTFTAPTESTHTCTQEQKKAEACTLEYNPVCGDDGETYGNACAACASGNVDSYASGECPETIGGDTDDHGCLIAAGYSYDEYVGACTRQWELTENQRDAARKAVAPLSYPVTVIDVIHDEEAAAYDVTVKRNDNEEVQHIPVADSQVCGTCPLYTPPVPGWCDDGTVWTEEPDECGCIGPPQCAQKLTEQEAKDIASASQCSEEGELVGQGTYNDYTLTWWFDLDIQSEGCAPACVVSEKTLGAEINWRCTGLII